MLPDTIAVVVDRAFGSKLYALASRIPVWVCDTPLNRLAAETIHIQCKQEEMLVDSDVTTFRISPQEPPEEMLINCLLDIDLHHPDWTRLEIYGAGLTPCLRQRLAEDGTTEYEETETGFVCSRWGSTAA